MVGRSLVLFNAPVDIEVAAKVKAIENATTGRAYMTHTEIMAFVRDMEDDGFGEGAVVVKKGVNQQDRKLPRNWGFVMGVAHYRAGNVPYFPLTVKWVLSDSIEFMWPDQLYLIHSRKTHSEVERCLNRQISEEYSGEK